MGFGEISIRCLVLLLQAVALPSPPKVLFPSQCFPTSTSKAQPELWGSSGAHLEPWGSAGALLEPWGSSSQPRKHRGVGVGATQSKPTRGAAGPGYPSPVSGQLSPWQGPSGASPPAGTGQGAWLPASLPATWGASALIVVYSRMEPFFGNCFV